MITGFEEYTHELTEQERPYLPVIVDILKHRKGIKYAIKNNEIAHRSFNPGRSIILTGARVRKMINVIRRYNLVPCLVSSSKGYYVASTKLEVLTYIQSLEERISAIGAVKIAMTQQMQMFGINQEETLSGQTELKLD